VETRVSEEEPRDSSGSWDSMGRPCQSQGRSGVCRVNYQDPCARRFWTSAELHLLARHSALATTSCFCPQKCTGELTAKPGSRTHLGPSQMIASTETHTDGGVWGLLGMQRRAGIRAGCRGPHPRSPGVTSPRDAAFLVWSSRSGHGCEFFQQVPDLQRVDPAQENLGGGGVSLNPGLRQPSQPPGSCGLGLVPAAVPTAALAGPPQPRGCD